jgi:sugar/nucleoside kinase (ribokinase family)
MNSRDTLATELNVLAEFDPVLPDHYKKADFLMLGNLTPQVQQKVLNQMTSRPKLIAMDTMNFWMEAPFKDQLLEVMKQVDVMIINDEEARQLSHEYSITKGAKKIMDMGPKFLVIKKGEHGALLFHGNEVFFAPALPLEDVFDPTGAGDTFAGGFMGYLASTRDISFENMKRGIIFGSALASFCVEKFGNQRLKEISKEEIDERVQEFIDLVQFDISLVD